MNILPVVEDSGLAKETIKGVEGQLASSLQETVETRQPEKVLEGDPEIHKGVFSPVTRLNCDVLSIIFAFCGKDDWAAPLRIGAVSCSWRQAILATPQAWAHPSLSNPMCARKVVLFFERSGQLPLHVCPTISQSIKLFSTVAHRIKCLSINGVDTEDDLIVFPNLEYLRITSRRLLISNDFLTQFPRLRHLYCREVGNTWSFDWNYERQAHLLLLEGLSLTFTPKSDFFNLVKGTRNPLVSLRIEIEGPVRPRGSHIILPNLITLEVEYSHHEPIRGSLELKTPKLKTYSQYKIEELKCDMIHRDLETVEYVSIDECVTLSCISSLRILRLLDGYSILEVINQLFGDSTLCPKLELIGVTWIDDMEYLREKLTRQLDEINKLRPVKIQLMLVPRPEIDLPHEFKEYECGPYNRCTDNG
ncbi:hypothetical protein M408DRAFT_23611 [Serendipita vermifera MAFF 305830]|uniref:F-box domain-containing protein n=1 Tax=Serendipita vermifera MAFF 305830 TaxID=933852 RepID=A0A0C3AVK2_SERVB|nr:hypothetical protein M408DRAFT_23611 [Serendipita vermifera MAFF 305830]